ncbi:MAG: glycosyltransferase family 39 protein [Betaproteobacteria bacterium]|nr:glycosyltransferase family 39 protein [Betaproteobacteria bacterium]
MSRLSVPRAQPGAVWVALILAVAAAIYVRVQAIAIQGGEVDYLVWATKNYFGGITPMYLKLANDVIALDYTSLAYPPGYPALLAAFRLAGMDGPQTMRVGQAVIDCAGVPLVYFLLRRAGLATVLALCGAVLYAVYPLWAFGSTFLLAEFISPVLILGALALTVICAAGDRPRHAFCAATGVYLGIAALIRPDMLLLPGLLALWLLWQHANRRGIAAVAVLVAAFALPIAAWGLHNRVENGHWVFSTTGGGNALWEGLGELPNDYGFVLDDRKAGEVLQQKGMKWLSVEANRYFTSEYFRAWREHPEFVLSVISWRWRHVLTDSENWLPEAGSAYGLKRLFDFGGMAMVTFATLLYLRSPRRLLLVLVPVIYALGSIGMTHWEARYVRYLHLSYLFAFLMLFDYLAGRVGERFRRTGLGILAIACAVTAWVAGDVFAYARLEAKGARMLAAATASAARGPLPGGYNLCALEFSGFVPGARVVRRDCALEVVTSNEPFDYQAMATVKIPEGSVVMAHFSGHVASGGVSIGLLLGDESRFIALSSRKSAGDFEGQLLGYAGERDTVKVVVSNFKPAGGSSQATLRDFELKCYPRPCGTGTGSK